MKALIIGLGSIGTRHARNLLQMGIEVMGIEPNREMHALQIPYINSIAEADADFAVICSPTDMHIQQATECAGKGMHLFIEKPPSNSAEGFAELARICKDKKLIAMVACNFRFTDGLKAVKGLAQGRQHGRLLSARAYFGQYLPNMRKDRDYRTLYAAGKAGGVILDSFHEFDYIYWLMGKPKRVKSAKGRVSRLEIANEDIAEATLDYGDALANIHVNYLRMKYRRACEFIFENATALWDYKADEQRELLEVYKSDGNREVLLDAALDVNKMYLDEMAHFLDCVKNRKKPILGLGEAGRILKIMLKVTG